MKQFCSLLNHFVNGNIAVAQTINNLIIDNNHGTVGGDELVIMIMQAIAENKNNLDLTDLTFRMALIDLKIQRLPQDELDKKYYSSSLFSALVSYVEGISIDEPEKRCPVQEQDDDQPLSETETMKIIKNFQKSYLERTAIPDNLTPNTKKMLNDMRLVECLDDMVAVANRELQRLKTPTNNIKSLIYILKINEAFPMHCGYIRYLLDKKMFPKEVRKKVNYNLSNPIQSIFFTDAEIIKTIQHYIKLPTSKPECIVLDREINHLLENYKHLQETGQILVPLKTAEEYTVSYHKELQAQRRTQLIPALKAYQTYLIERYNLDINKPKNSVSGQKLSVIKDLLVVAENKQLGDDQALVNVQAILAPKIDLLAKYQPTIGNKLLDCILSCFSQRLADYLKKNGGLFSPSKGANLVKEISQIDPSLTRMPTSQGA